MNVISTTVSTLPLGEGAYVSMQSTPPAWHMQTRQVERGQIRHTVEFGNDLLVDVDKDGFVLGIECYSRPYLTQGELAQILRCCKLVFA